MKRTNLIPVGNKEFDVTNPDDAGLSVMVKDKDYFCEDDFLDQILISSLHDLRKHIDCLVKISNLIVLIVVRLNYNRC